MWENLTCFTYFVNKSLIWYEHIDEIQMSLSHQCPHETSQYVVIDKRHFPWYNNNNRTQSWNRHEKDNTNETIRHEKGRHYWDTRFKFIVTNFKFFFW